MHKLVMHYTEFFQTKSIEWLTEDDADFKDNEVILQIETEEQYFAKGG